MDALVVEDRSLGGGGSGPGKSSRSWHDRPTDRPPQLRLPLFADSNYSSRQCSAEPSLDCYLALELSKHTSAASALHAHVSEPDAHTFTQANIPQQLTASANFTFVTRRTIGGCMHASVIPRSIIINPNTASAARVLQLEPGFTIR